MRPPETCPNCGADIPRHARVCPACGSDEETGWSEDANTDGLDLPDENFDYDKFVKEEFSGETPAPVPQGIHWFWWLVAVGLLLGLVGFLFR